MCKSNNKSIFSFRISVPNIAFGIGTGATVAQFVNKDKTYQYALYGLGISAILQYIANNHPEVAKETEEITGLIGVALI